MGRVSDLYIDMLENMSEEERFEHEQKEALNDPERYEELIVDGYKIEKSIPIRSGYKKRSRWWKLIDAMSEGDSVLLKDLKEAEKLRSLMKANEIPASIRQEENGYRLWRKRKKE